MPEGGLLEKVLCCMKSGKVTEGKGKSTQEHFTLGQCALRFGRGGQWGVLNAVWR